MKRNTLLGILLIFLFTCVLLYGCNNTKDETELVEELKGSEAFYLPDGTEIKEFSIIKRLTDEDEKTDKVYIQVDVENPDIFQSRAYIMNYTQYNEGWMLDSIEEYWEDNYWAVQAKTKPSAEIVIEELVDWSDNSIQTYYNYLSIPSTMAGPMYFEDGKYRYALTNESLDGNTYQCIISVVRPFEYVSSHEEIKVTISISPYTYAWELVSAESLSLTAEWFVAHIWSSEEESIGFSSSSIGKDSMILSDAGAYGYSIPNVTLELAIPSFDRIYPAMTIMDYDGLRGDIYCEITLWPNKMWVKDWTGEIAEFDGKIERVYAKLEDPEKYAEVAKNTIEALWKNHDIDATVDSFHPSMRAELIDEYTMLMSADWVELWGWDPGQELVSYTIGDIQIYDDYCQYEPSVLSREFNFANSLREEGFRIDAIGIVDYELIYQDNTISLTLLLVESDNQILVLDLDC